MGAGQSSDKASANGIQTVKTSYYELIGVQRTATEEEIKKAYRRKALELHPDRNYGNEEEATKIFAEVQAAYEVLSDPQERAWYDSHESAILQGEDVGDEAGVPAYQNVRITTADDLARLVRKFNSSIEFSDAPSGFFGFVRETFEQLAKEEEIAAEWDNAESREYPTFGHKDDEYDDVVKTFYAAWQGFSTVKSFSWKDKYRLSEAPDRWMRRRMEQENKKLRQDGVREFNDAVRSLVAFIRKRDPRYVPSTQTEAERQKVLRDAAASQAARARAANLAKLQETDGIPEWAKFREPDEEEESEEEIIEQQIFECVACDKEFKSERQWEAHEKSKKHQKAVFALQKKMRKENAHLDLSGQRNGVATADEEEEDSEEVDFENSALNVKEVGHEANLAGANGEESISSDNGSASESEAADNKADQNLRGSTKSNKTRKDDDSNDDDSEHDNDNATDGDDNSDEKEHDDDDYASMETIQARLQETSLQSPPTDLHPDDLHQSQQPEPVKKLGKAAQKRAKKAAAAVSASDNESNAHRCATCNSGFPSKTQLFQHIKDHGHAAPKAATAAAKGAGKGKKGKGKR